MLGAPRFHILVVVVDVLKQKNKLKINLSFAVLLIRETILDLKSNVFNSLF